MEWNIFTPQNERYWLYDLTVSPNPDHSCKLEFFLPDGLFVGGTGVYLNDEHRKARDPDTWQRTHLAPFLDRDRQLVIELLDYLLAVRRGAIDPAVTPPPYPAGGGVEAVLRGVEDHAHE